METLLKIVPLLVILVLLLPPFRFHVLVAGLVAGAVAAVLGGLDAAEASTVFFEGLVQIMSITSVMMFAATALVLARAGATVALLEIIQRTFKGRVELVAAGMVLVQALAAYAAGTAAANTLVTAPLIFALTGFVPALVAGHGIVSGASFATSPASAESAFISEAMGMTPFEYSAFMRPFTIGLWVIGIALAYYGVSRYRKTGRLQPPPAEEVAEEKVLATSTTSAVATENPRPGADNLVPDTTTAGAGSGVTDTSAAAPEREAMRPEPGPWRLTFPFLVFVLLILVGPVINTITGVQIFTNLTIPLVVLTIAAISMRLSPNKVGELFIDGGLTILRYLFLVGLFLGFINMMAKYGTFEAIATLTTGIPAILTIGALIGAFLIAIPSAAYTVAIDALIIPVLAAAGVTPTVFGFVGIAVAQGAMMSPVQINVAATAHGFRREILDIVRNNARFMIAVFIVTLVTAAIVASVTG